MVVDNAASQRVLMSRCLLYAETLYIHRLSSLLWLSEILIGHTRYPSTYQKNRASNAYSVLQGC